MRFSYKPHPASWVRLISPLIHAVELFCLYFGFQVTTGYPGWYGAALGLTMMCLFELTIIPAVLLPLTLMGAYALTGLPWFVTLPFFAIPYLYNFYYMRVFRRQEAWLKIMRQPQFALRTKQII